MQEEGQLFRGHSPIDDSKDDEEGSDEHQIVKDEIGEGARSHRGHVCHKKDGWKIDLTGTGEFQERDDQPSGYGGKEIASRMAFFKDRLKKSFL